MLSKFQKAQRSQIYFWSRNLQAFALTLSEVGAHAWLCNSNADSDLGASKDLDNAGWALYFFRLFLLTS